MYTTCFDYDLPEGAIAQQPVEPRDAARLLVDEGASREPTHHRVRDLPSFLREGDLVVLNETRVRPARLDLCKHTGGRVEVLLLEQIEASLGAVWEVLVRPGRRVPPGTELSHDDVVVLEVGERLEGGRRVVRFAPGVEPEALAAKIGELPLPPYIKESPVDVERYQTVFGRPVSSAAAPTAGLHLTDGTLAAIRARGSDVAIVELAIGLDTFRPMETDRIEDHVMHSERYRVPAETWTAVKEAERVIAVGTTVTRALESVAASGALEGRTELFIHGDYQWQVVDALLTNFHLPRSSLLAMIDSFIGPRWRTLYETALVDHYRFLSFGDAMLLLQRGRS